MTTYIPTIGLEIHAELKTETKMFCHSRNDTDETDPNVNICPICMAHPGTLPVINKEAVKHVLTIGVALNGTCADFTEFDRKNYFYPDIPKGYQISQYKYPLVSQATLADVDITRIHLEEDTARSQHDAGGYSLVNYNRAGVPLMELVTEPVITSGAQASHFARELQLLLQYVGVGDAHMEKGEMRVEANVSVAPEGGPLGTKVEVKNLNSFRSVEKAIAYEIERHTTVYNEGETISQETRGWDEVNEETYSQRKKEESHDYRYFPEPDLPKLYISEIPEFAPNTLREDLPELPWERRARYEQKGLTSEVASVFTKNKDLGDFFDSVITLWGNDDTAQCVLAANYLSSDVGGLLKERKISIHELLGEDRDHKARAFAALMKMVYEKTLSSRGGKQLLPDVLEQGNDPYESAQKQNLIQTHDKEYLTSLAEEMIQEYPDVVERYRAGKESAITYLIGQGMRKSKGSAHPQALETEIRSQLDG